LRQLLETHGARIKVPDDRNFETEGEAIESGLRRTVEGRDMVMRGLIRAVYRFRDATLVAEKRIILAMPFRIFTESWSERRIW
jgi:hypothetical protein